MKPNTHIAQILSKVSPALRRKYLRGVKEHGGGLWKKNVGPEIENELLDLIVYVYTREEQVSELVVAANQIVLDAQNRIIDYATIPKLAAALAPFLNKPEKQ